MNTRRVTTGTLKHAGENNSLRGTAYNYRLTSGQASEMIARATKRAEYATQHGMTLSQVHEFESTYGVDVIELTENRLREEREFQALSYWERMPDTYRMG